ncbi:MULTISPECIES: hypothetical protein [unclassified Streptomyces]|uniref:hypothetical protein n=1 Tax=unclassified Streptomyces TaxID=2593676 RepID=UPI002E29D397|nr:hypothetical protein [Streptomyces sp. NBC_00273]
MLRRSLALEMAYRPGGVLAAEIHLKHIGVARPRATVRTPAGPRTQRGDRDVLNLLTKHAKNLHIGPANFCSFADPSRALPQTRRHPHR